MKILKHRNLLGCLFAVILAMPLIQIGVRCAYTIFNKNAKDSYSGDTTYEINYKYESNEVTSIDDLVVGNIYYSDDLLIEEPFQGGFTHDLSFTIVKCYTYSVEFQGNTSIDEIFINDYDSNENNFISLDIYPSDNEFYAYFSNSDAYSGIYYGNVTQIEFTNCVFYIENDTYLGNFKNAFRGTQNYDVINPQYTNYNVIESVNIDTSGTLDNAFEYSINKITESNNIGELKFFTWFADLFLDLDNSSNALYINFINWYFNYALLVSAVYILFLALMWFIMWIRRLLERGMDFGQRGY